MWFLESEFSSGYTEIFSLKVSQKENDLASAE